MSAFRLESPWLLLLLLLVPALLWMFRNVLRWKSRSMEQLGDPALVQLLIAQYSPRRFRMKFLMLLTAIVLLILALVNPQREVSDTIQNQQGVDIMVALDVSNSMLSRDVQPDRLGRAKILVQQLIDRSPNDRIGLVIFAGHAYLQVPLTLDHQAVLMLLNSVDPQTVATQGTSLAEALQLCYQALTTTVPTQKAVILITDGEDHEENVMEVVDRMREEGMLIQTIGVGTPEGGTIIDPQTRELKRDAEGKTVRTQLKEELLKEIAVKGRGNYLHLDATGDISGKIIDIIDKIEKQPIHASGNLQYDSFFPWLLGCAILFLFLEGIMSEQVKQRK